MTTYQIEQPPTLYADWFCRQLTHAQGRIFGYLAELGFKFDSVFPSVESIATDLGMAHSTVYAAFNAFEAPGRKWIERGKLPCRNTKWKRNVYHLKGAFLTYIEQRREAKAKAIAARQAADAALRERSVHQAVRSQLHAVAAAAVREFRRTGMAAHRAKKSPPPISGDNSCFLISKKESLPQPPPKPVKKTQFLEWWDAQHRPKAEST